MSHLPVHQVAHPLSRARPRPHPQHGAAALAVTMMLCFALVLGAAFVNRNLLFEQRSSANQYRSAQAFEAAEAGLEWGVAQLNATQRLGADCAPSVDPAADSFRARYLAFTARTGAIAPRSWDRAGVATPRRAACVRTATGWACHCPASGDPVLAVPAAGTADDAPAFVLEILPSARPGVVRLVATGCAQLAGACAPGAPGAAGRTTDATARVEALFGLVGALRSAPAATVTTRGDFDAGGAAIGLHNNDPQTGSVVDAGGRIVASAARVTVPAGAPRADPLLGGDAALAALGAEPFFSAHFGMGRTAWRRQPGVVRIDCSAGCDATAIAAAAAGAADAALIHVDGDLRLAGPLALGTLERPVMLVVSGRVQIDGAVALHGVLHAGAIVWDTPADGAFVRGALLSETSYRGNGTPALAYDANLLAALRRAAGSFARVGGSWRDF